MHLAPEAVNRAHMQERFYEAESQRMGSRLAEAGRLQRRAERASLRARRLQRRAERVSLRARRALAAAVMQ